MKTTTIGNEVITESTHLAEGESIAKTNTSLLKGLAKILSHPATKTVFVSALLICICVTSTYAQTGIDQTSADITTTIKNIFTQVYDNFRIPISAVALIVGAYYFGSGDPNGPKRAGLIAGGIILFWIIPGLISFFTDVTKQ